MKPHFRKPIIAMMTFGVLAISLSSCGTDTLKRCVPEESPTAASVDMDGVYEGRRDAEGIRLTLRSGGKGEPDTVTVEAWPTGDYYREELGDTFDGSGTWEIDRSAEPGKSPMLRLHFDKPRQMIAGDTVDLLTVASDDERVVLYDNADPDVCPAFRLDLKKP